MKYQNISIVIPTFNGKELLEKYLPSVLDACKDYSFEKTELIVIDDASSDGTADYLESNFPFIKVIRQQTNKGFSVSANHGIFSAKNRIVVLLNNDVEVANNFLSFFLHHFEDKNLFAVRPGLKNTSEDEIIKHPKIGGKFKYGFFDVPAEVKENTDLAFFAGGGACVYDREKFIELAGFDEIFSPFYFEDVDLSYRAWKRGWKIIYEPKCWAYHQGCATISKFYSARYINIITERNKYFLIWKNITDIKLIFEHFVFVPVRIIIFLVCGNFAPLAGLFCALKSLDKIIKKRKIEKQFTKVSDNTIFGYFKA